MAGKAWTRALVRKLMRRRSPKDSPVTITYFSDSRYEHLTVELDYDGEPLAQINQDGEELELEIFALPKGKSVVRMPLKDFQLLIKAATENLIKHEDEPDPS